jgi:hypothetical protein
VIFILPKVTEKLLILVISEKTTNVKMLQMDIVCSQMQHVLQRHRSNHTAGFYHVMGAINRHDITEILLKVALNTIKQTKIKPNLVAVLFFCDLLQSTYKCF